MPIYYTIPQEMLNTMVSEAVTGIVKHTGKTEEEDILWDIIQKAFLPIAGDYTNH